MLDLFRKQKAASKWILAIITGFTAVGMVVFFIPTGITTTDETSATQTIAQVGSAQILVPEYAVSLKRLLKNPNYPKDMNFLKQLGIPRQLLDDLITQKLLYQEAEKYGLTASDREVRDRILAYPLFQQMGGSFNMQIYQRVLEQNGSSIDEFETGERQQIIIEKLKHLITDGILVTPDEVEKAYRDANEKVSVEYALFDPVEIQKTMKTDDAELKKYFQANTQKFQTGEQRRAKYVLVDLNKVRSTLKVTDADLQQYYQQNRTRYFVSDRIRVSHILFATPGKTPEEIAALRQKAVEVLAQVRAGGDFAQLARQYSDDRTSKTAGGDLGWINQESPFVDEFKQAAFSLGVGAVSDLVQSPFGFHIIKVTAKEAAHTLSFEEAKEQIRPTYMAQKADQEGSAEANNIFSALASRPNDLEGVARQFGAEVRETPLFTLGESVPDIGSNPDFEKSVFGTALNKVGAPVRVGPGFVIPEVLEIKPAHTPQFEEVRAKVEAAYKQDKSQDAAKQKAAAFAQTASKAKDFLAAAKAAGAKAETSEPFKRYATEKTLGNTQEITASAFSMKPGDTSGALPLGNKFIVFRVKTKEEVKPEDFQKAKASFTVQLLDQKRTEAFQAFQDDLLDRSIKSGTVKVNEKALDAALRRAI
ncbi:MAG: peptidyl-prolyl cis-trans isomerase [Acidobacteriia bacterium]|nr:peptidyl-prolyl cis-trans isomerase [Terriglobia bacterium]